MSTDNLSPRREEDFLFVWKVIGCAFACPDADQRWSNLAALGGAAGDVMQRLEQARQMLAAKLISDAEYEAIKAKILSAP